MGYTCSDENGDRVILPDNLNEIKLIVYTDVVSGEITGYAIYFKEFDSYVCIDKAEYDVIKKLKEE